MPKSKPGEPAYAPSTKYATGAGAGSYSRSTVAFYRRRLDTTEIDAILQPNDGDRSIMRRTEIVSVGLTAAAWLIVTPITPGKAVSFDCAKASNTAELLVCENPELSELDDRMAAAYSAARRRSGNSPALVSDQRAWLMRRNNCRTAVCVASEYQMRLASMDAGQFREDSASITGAGSIEVELQASAGILTVPVSINNAITLAFTIDSGAADVSIPADVVLTLMRMGSITSDDFLGKRTYTMADGSTVPSTIFRIRSLKVGNRVLRDVTGSIASVKGELLLGQSFLSRFRSWSINNLRGVLILE
jgi:uncharacterized protein